ATNNKRKKLHYCSADPSQAIQSLAIEKGSGAKRRSEPNPTTLLGCILVLDGSLIFACRDQMFNKPTDMGRWVTGCYQPTSSDNRKARRAAIPVLRKLTPSLLRTRLRSRDAPSRLSANMPAMAAAAHNPDELLGSRPVTTHTTVTSDAATTPAAVPATLIPPSVPAGTCSQVVIRFAFALIACPYSLETVSAAASASAAAHAKRKT